MHVGCALTSGGVHPPPSSLAENGASPLETTPYLLKTNTSLKASLQARKTIIRHHLKGPQVSIFPISRESLSTNPVGQKGDVF